MLEEASASECVRFHARTQVSVSLICVDLLWLKGKGTSPVNLHPAFRKRLMSTLRPPPGSFLIKKLQTATVDGQVTEGTPRSLWLMGGGGSWENFVMSKTCFHSDCVNMLFISKMGRILQPSGSAFVWVFFPKKNQETCSYFSIRTKLLKLPVYEHVPIRKNMVIHLKMLLKTIQAYQMKMDHINACCSPLTTNCIYSASLKTNFLLFECQGICCLYTS